MGSVSGSSKRVAVARSQPTTSWSNGGETTAAAGGSVAGEGARMQAASRPRSA